MVDGADPPPGERLCCHLGTAPGHRPSRRSPLRAEDKSNSAGAVVDEASAAFASRYEADPQARDQLARETQEQQRRRFADAQAVLAVLTRRSWEASNLERPGGSPVTEPNRRPSPYHLEA